MTANKMCGRFVHLTGFHCMQANIIAVVCSEPNYNIIELTFAINLHIIFIAVEKCVWNHFLLFSISMGGNCVLLTNKL